MSEFKKNQPYIFLYGWNSVEATFPVKVLRITDKAIKLERTDRPFSQYWQTSLTFWIPLSVIKLDGNEIQVSHWYNFSDRQKDVILFDKDNTK